MRCMQCIVDLDCCLTQGEEEAIAAEHLCELGSPSSEGHKCR